MYLISDPSKDHRHPKTTTGAYEWWYFDALDADSNFGIVLIFYDGLLFSPDYHEAQVKGLNATADKHPGLSISLYEGRDTIYYALKSFSPDKAFFSDSSCDLSIGKNTVSSSIKNSELVYEIGINDQLPNGLHLVGKLKFYSKHVPAGIASENVEANHQWNLVQAKASVTAELQLVTPTNEIRNIEFEGTGYHDHNLGFRPIEGDFDQWYWGRVHVNEGTLVWYIMYKEDAIQQVAWLINESDGTYTPVDFIRMKSPARTTILGLKVFDQLEVGIQGQSYCIQTEYVWDEGPFYIRYKVHLRDGRGREVDGAQSGIAEYIRPDRIIKKWVKPMIKTRYYREDSRANWIQRSLMLSKWTW